MKIFNSVAQMKLATIKAGQYVETFGYHTKGDAGAARYLVVASQAADGYGDHVLANGTVAVLQIDDGFSTLEQLGYDGTNAGSIANAVLPIGIHIKLLKDSYVVDETILIDSGNIILGLNESDSKLVAVSTLTGNVIDTLNYDALVAGNIVDVAPVSGLVCPHGMRLERFSVQGNFDTYPNGATNVTQGNGMGIRVYGKQFYLNRLVIAETANVGLYTELSITGTFAAPYLFIDNTKQGSITDVSIFQNGKEGFIFKGPTDIWIDRVRCGVNANSSNVQGTATPSVELVGLDAHGINITRAAHFGFINGFNNANGRGIYIDRLAGEPSVRIDANHMQGDSSWGNIEFGLNTRVQVNSIETHGIVGDGVEPHIRDRAGFGVKCPDITCFRENNELGSTCYRLESTSIGSVLDINVVNDGGATNLGHGLDLRGFNFSVDHNISSQTGTSSDTSPSTGVIVRSSANRYALSGLAVLNTRNYNFEGGSNADLNTDINVRSRDAATAGFTGINRFSSIPFKQSKFTDEVAGVFKRNFDVQTVAVDASTITLQSVVIPHKFLRTPLESEIQLTLSYNTGSSPDVIKPPYVVGANATDVTVQYEFAGGAVGNMSINMSIN